MVQLKNIKPRLIKFLYEDPEFFWAGITSIGNRAFSMNSLLKQIEIPGKVASIGYNAFEQCANLRKVKLNEGIKEIMPYAFANCVNLKEIEIPKSIKKINSETFCNCTSLEKVVLPDGLETIQGGAFENCISLKEIKIPDSVTSMGYGAFRKCSGLENITLPKGIIGIEDNMFAFCTSLKEIEIPSNIDNMIGNNAFSYCKGLEKVVINGDFYSIGMKAFEECESLKEVQINSSEFSMHSFAFVNCISLEKINLSGAISINCRAFVGCYNLKEVILPGCANLFKVDAFDFKVLKYLIIKKDGSLMLVNDYSEYKDIDMIFETKHISNVFKDADIASVFKDEYKIKDNLKRIKELSEMGVVIPSCIAADYDENFDELLNKDYKVMKYLIKMMKEKDRSANLAELYMLAEVMGVFEKGNVTIKIKGNEIPVRDVAYTVLQGAFNHGLLEMNKLHMRFQSLSADGYNEQFLKFMANKTNLSELSMVEEQQNGFTTRVYEWFKEREKLVIDIENVNNSGLPTEEKNRYKILTYDETTNGVDRIKWKVPTVELLKKEFLEKKFSGIKDDRSREIADYLANFNLYTQKHFDKALEIDKERIESGISDRLTKQIIKEDLLDSVKDYERRVEILKQNIVLEAQETMGNQVDTASKIFTYEMLAKSDKANFAIGLLTSCCATLYGAGAGAQRAMIIHPDIQPLVIRDIRGNIVAFGIIYVNKEEGYAVVNDFEVNHKYIKRKEELKEIYTKAMQGVEAFVKTYNEENIEKKILCVTCGISPNWEGINNYIKENPKSPILKAVNFYEYAYNGSGYWNGDWHKDQYLIWKDKNVKK